MFSVIFNLKYKIINYAIKYYFEIFVRGMEITFQIKSDMMNYNC